MLALGTLTEGRGGEGWPAGCAVRNLDEKQKQGKTRLSTAASIHLRAWAESDCRVREYRDLPLSHVSKRYLLNLDPDLELPMGCSLVLIRNKWHQRLIRPRGVRYPSWSMGYLTRVIS